MIQSKKIKERQLQKKSLELSEDEPETLAV